MLQEGCLCKINFVLYDLQNGISAGITIIFAGLHHSSQQTFYTLQLFCLRMFKVKIYEN